MDWRAFLSPSRPAPFATALDDEIARIDRLVLFAWQGVGVVGMVVGASTAVLVPGFGVAPILVSVVFLAFWVAVAELAKRGKGRALLPWLNPVVESSLPALMVLMLVRTQGPEYALGSWVPPMMYAAVVVVGIVRLRPLTPLVVSVLAAVQYELLYALYVRGMLSEVALHMRLFGPPMQIVRSVSLIIGGGLGSLTAVGLRNAIGKAAKTARSQDLFGKYRIERAIASGGMATVYLATYCPEGGFARPVALKRIHPHLARQEAFVDAFRNEAELCARLVHPNIVQVFDFGRVDQTYFLAMEYVDGITLNTLMKSMRDAREILPPRMVAWIGREMTIGVEYSHSGARDESGGVLRVVHRDLSPANVLLSRNGQVKITDFGIARALRGARAYLTDSVAGHLSYMAPEQATGHETDERSDLFAIAVILWELLAGTTLFRREFEAATLNAILSAKVPMPSTLRADLGDVPWDAFFARALEREPSARFPTAREMGAALADMLERVGPPRGDEAALLVAHVADQARERQARDDSPTLLETKSASSDGGAAEEPTSSDRTRKRKVAGG